MDCSDNNQCSSCLYDILKKIVLLQKQDFDFDTFIGCDKPFLGPIVTNNFYNTRPIQLYVSSTGEPWNFNYTLCDGTEGTSNILRVESLDDCCCTCRILYTNLETNQIQSTDQFVTIDLHCCGAIRCYSDTYVDI